MDPTFAERNVNEGFSGGEKKRHEILQMELLKPRIAILDETDSGLDVDALKVVSEGVNRVRATGEVGVLLITHYTRILRYIEPDFVHVFVDGRIAEEGGAELANGSRPSGYDRFAPGRSLMPGAMTSTTTTDAPGRRRTSTGLRRDFPILPATTARRQRRWSTSTRRPRRRSRAPCWTRWRVLRPRAQRAVAPRRALPRRGGDRRVRGRARRRRRASSARPARRGRVHQERHRGAQPRHLRASNAGRAGAPAAAAPATRSCVTETEHHSNIVPWQLLRRAPAPRCAARASPTPAGSTSTTSRDSLTERTRVVALAHVSNVLGTVNPVAGWSARARERRGARRARRLPGVPHLPVDVAALGADFVAFTGHKMLRPHRDRRAVAGAASCSPRCRRSSAAAR